MRLLLIIFIFIFIGAGSAVADIGKYLEKGDIEPVIKSALNGKGKDEALYLLKAIADILVNEDDVPAYLKMYARGIIAEKQGNIKLALDSYINSVHTKSDYNPSYYRLNELIREYPNPASYREEIKNILRMRFSDPPPLLIENPPNKYVILVEKMSQYMFVYKGKELVDLYPITTGQAWEDKFREGDKRTPEGIYFFTEYMDVSKLPPMYGNFAVALNYPNPYDKLLGKTGSGIWLHGSDANNRNNIPFSTRGCVVADNRDLDIIKRYIKLYNTPIAIYKVISSEIVIDDVKSLIFKWKEAWESKNLEDFISFYSDNFKWKGGGKKSWKRYKSGTILNKEYINVDIKDLTILAFNRHEEEDVLYYVAEFYQIYRSNSYSDEGIKRLYIVNEGGQLRIISEEFIMNVEE